MTPCTDEQSVLVLKRKAECKDPDMADERWLHTYLLNAFNWLLFFAGTLEKHLTMGLPNFHRQNLALLFDSLRLSLF